MGELSTSLRARICEVTGARDAWAGERIQRLWSGYGEIRRVLLAQPAAPSVVVKQVRPPATPQASDQAGRRAHARKLRSYAVEMAFYDQLAARCDAACRVAAALHCEAHDGGWTFVLEDLDASGYRQRYDSFFRPGTRSDPASARACLAWLAHFHATFMGAGAEALWPTGTYWHLATRPDELAASEDSQLRAAAAWLDARLHGAVHRTLVHGDAKLENFCFDPAAGRVAAVDFQYVGGGVGVQDVAYFLSSCLDGPDCDARAKALLDHYFATLAAALRQRQPALDAGAVEREWRGLYPVAWADFCRFLSGWAPQHHKLHPYSRRMTQQALWRRAQPRR